MTKFIKNKQLFNSTLDNCLNKSKIKTKEMKINDNLIITRKDVLFIESAASLLIKKYFNCHITMKNYSESLFYNKIKRKIYNLLLLDNKYTYLNIENSYFQRLLSDNFTKKKDSNRKNELVSKIDKLNIKSIHEIKNLDTKKRHRIVDMSIKNKDKDNISSFHKNLSEIYENSSEYAECLLDDQVDKDIMKELINITNMSSVYLNEKTNDTSLFFIKDNDIKINSNFNQSTGIKNAKTCIDEKDSNTIKNSKSRTVYKKIITIPKDSSFNKTMKNFPKSDENFDQFYEINKISDNSNDICNNSVNIYDNSNNISDKCLNSNKITNNRINICDDSCDDNYKYDNRIDICDDSCDDSCDDNYEYDNRINICDDSCDDNYKSDNCIDSCDDNYKSDNRINICDDSCDDSCDDNYKYDNRIDICDDSCDDNYKYDNRIDICDDNYKSDNYTDETKKLKLKEKNNISKLVGNKYVSLYNDRDVNDKNRFFTFLNPFQSEKSFNKALRKNDINLNKFSLIGAKKNSNEFPGTLHFIIFSVKEYDVKYDEDDLRSIKIKINGKSEYTPVFSKKENEEIKYHTSIRIKKARTIKVKLVLEKHKKPTFLNMCQRVPLKICEFKIQIEPGNEMRCLEGEWNKCGYGIFKRLQKHCGKVICYSSYIADDEIYTADVEAPHNLYTLNKWIVVKMNVNNFLFAGSCKVQLDYGEWKQMHLEWYGYSIYMYDIYNTFKKMVNIVEASILGEEFSEWILGFRLKDKIIKIKFDTKEKVDGCFEALKILFKQS